MIFQNWGVFGHPKSNFGLVVSMLATDVGDEEYIGDNIRYWCSKEFQQDVTNVNVVSHQLERLLPYQISFDYSR